MILEQGRSLSEKELGRSNLPPKFSHMPYPSYISEGLNTTGNGEIIKWIGFNRESLDGKEKKFLWYTNFKGINPRKRLQRGDMADFIVRVLFTDESEAAWGPAVDLRESDPNTGKVQIVTERGAYGLYVEKERRPGFDARISIGGLRSARDLRMLHPEEYETLYNKAFTSVSKLLTK